jgi:fatty acid desaturase
MALPFLAIAYFQCGWIQHEAGHNSLFCNIKVDKFFQFIYFNLIMGGSYNFWNHQHNGHHANTQHEEYDLDFKNSSYHCLRSLCFKERKTVFPIFTFNSHQVSTFDLVLV